MRRRKTTEQFVADARGVHGEKYCYSKAQYVDARTKVQIICPKHGPFWQTPDKHLRGRGCPGCGVESRARSKSLGKEGFISKAVAVHGERYDYSKSQYVDNRTKVKIICPDHGEFMQTPNNHLQGQGCPACGVELRSRSRSLSKEEFIAKAVAVHGGKYDYNLAEYVDANTKVRIICPEHGVFGQAPRHHLSGKGCWACGVELRARSRTLSKEEFVAKALRVHGEKYDYSKAEYRGAHTKAEIICPEHGPFWQTPSDHMQGSGCPRCRESKGEIRVSEVLSSLNLEFKSQWRPIIYGCNRKAFDFYLPKYKLIIEYDGIQHFEPREHFGGYPAWADTVERDLIKIKWAIENGYRMIRIAYWDFDKIEEILVDEISI